MQERPQNHPSHGWGAGVLTHQLLGLGTGPRGYVPPLLPCPSHRESGLVVLDKSPRDTERPTSSASGSLPKITEESPKNVTRVTAPANLVVLLSQAAQRMTTAPAPTPAISYCDLGVPVPSHPTPSQRSETPAMPFWPASLRVSLWAGKPLLTGVQVGS